MTTILETMWAFGGLVAMVGAMRTVVVIISKLEGVDHV